MVGFALWCLLWAGVSVGVAVIVYPKLDEHTKYISIGVILLIGAVSSGCSLVVGVSPAWTLTAVGIVEAAQCVAFWLMIRRLDHEFEARKSYIDKHAWDTGLHLGE